MHVGGSWEEIAASESAVWKDQVPEQPFVLLAQQSLFDQTRAPEGKQTGWAYCHVPHGCNEDMTDRIESQIERFAPGFRDLILARHIFSPSALEAYNANYIGGDITGGVMDVKQLLARPALRRSPYTTPNRADLYLFCIDSAGWRRPRNVWLPRCPRCTLSRCCVIKTWRTPERRSKRALTTAYERHDCKRRAVGLMIVVERKVPPAPVTFLQIEKKMCKLCFIKSLLFLGQF